MDPKREEQAKQRAPDAARGASAGAPRPDRGGARRRPSRGGSWGLALLGVWMFFTGSCFGGCRQKTESVFSHSHTPWHLP